MENTELQVQLTDENIVNENSIPDNQLKEQEYLNDLLLKRKDRSSFCKTR